MTWQENEGQKLSSGSLVLENRTSMYCSDRLVNTPPEDLNMNGM